MREAIRATPERFQELLASTFDGFRIFGDPSLEKGLSQAIKFCCDMASADKPGRWLTLLGPSGTGKTMLAKRVVGFFRRYLDCLPDERNKPGEVWMRRGGFKNWGDVVGDMLNGDYSGIRDLRDDWFVALDDIGVEYSRNRELAISKLYEILNARLGLFTVITANIKLDDIHEKLDARIASRLLRDGSSLVNMDTQDFNLRD